MKPISWKSDDAWLLDRMPNWAHPVELRATFDVRTSAGETGREERSPLADRPTLSFRFTSIYRGEQVPSLRNALQMFRTEPILCPFWPALRVWNEVHPVSSWWWYIQEPLDEPYVLHEDDLPPRFPERTTLTPILITRFASFPEPNAHSNELLSVEWDLVEDGEDFLYVDDFEWPVGPVTATGTPYLFPFRQNTAQEPQTQKPNWNLHTETLGHGRTALRYAEPQPTRRSETASFVLAGKDPWKLFRWWIAHKGPWKSFWFAGGINESRLTASVVETDAVLSVKAPLALGSNSYILMHDSKKRVARRVTSVVGNTWNLDSAVGVPFEAERTVLWPLQLSRFEGQSLSLKFEHASLATTELKVVETPWEMTLPPGESAASHGSASGRTYTYTFRLKLPSGVREWRFTNYATSVNFGELEFVPTNIEHGEIRQSLGLDPDTVTVTAAAAVDSPLLKFIPVASPFPLTLEIAEIIFNDGFPTRYTLFTGLVRSVDMNLPKLTATCSALGGLGDRQFPRRVTGIRCNYRLYGPGCGLDPNTWKWTGTVAGWTAATGTLAIANLKKNGVTVGAGSLAEHLFAAGYIEVGTGEALLPRWITDSAVPGAGAINVILDEGFIATPALGTVVALWAGCDLRHETCINRFSNGVNFGGYPNMVIGNPVVARIKLSNSQGAKK